MHWIDDAEDILRRLLSSLHHEKKNITLASSKRMIGPYHNAKICVYLKHYFVVCWGEGAQSFCWLISVASEAFMRRYASPGVYRLPAPSQGS